MPVKTQLMEDMKQAMRDHDTVTLGALRFLLADIKNWEIDHGEQNDEGVQKIIAKQIKQMKDAMGDYEKGGRTDLVTAEQAKIDVIAKYLPAQLSDQEILEIINQIKAQTEVLNPGQLIGQVMARVQGKADGGRVAQLVKNAK